MWKALVFSILATFLVACGETSFAPSDDVIYDDQFVEEEDAMFSDSVSSPDTDPTNTDLIPDEAPTTDYEGVFCTMTGCTLTASTQFAGTWDCGAPPNGAPPLAFSGMPTDWIPNRCGFESDE